MPDRLRDIAIREDATLRGAMEVIDRGAVEIALVVDENNKLIGTLTDGDVRRALLRGASLEDRVDRFMQRRFTAVGPAEARVEVLDLMRARTLSQIPIVDEEGHLIGLHLLREIMGAQPRPNWAVVMAGGRGERLRPLTDTLPKPMIKVAGRPILERIVLHLVGCGIRRIFIALNYMGEVIENHFGDGAALGCKIDYLREEKPLGTGGALTMLPDRPTAPLLVLNGDLISQFDVRGMLAFHSEGRCKMTVGVHEFVHTVPFGVLDMEGDQVVGIREKPCIVSRVNAGIYVLEPELLDRIPPDTHYPITEIVKDCLARGESVGGVPVDEEWLDIGRPQDLSRARGKE